MITIVANTITIEISSTCAPGVQVLELVGDIIEILIPGQQGIPGPPGPAGPASYESVSKNLVDSDFQLVRDAGTGLLSQIAFSSGITKSFTRSPAGKLAKITLAGAALPAGIKRVKNLNRGPDGKLVSVTYTFT